MDSTPGILLGVDTGLTRELQNAFKDTGTAHIIAISGFNIAIIAGVFYAIFKNLFGERFCSLLAMLGIIFYTVLVSADAAVARAEAVAVAIQRGILSDSSNFAKNAAHGSLADIIGRYTSEEPAMSNVHASTHPLVAHKLSRLRDKNTEPKKFRELVREIAALLAYEATADLATTPRELETPLAKMTGQELKEKIGLVPILRAGLGMVEGIWGLMPSAEVWHIGLYRDEKTLKPVEYYNKLPVEPRVSVCLILDPMLATGGSATATADLLKRWGVKKIKFVGLIAAPEGIQAMQSAHPDIEIYIAAIDDHLNERAYIVPGLGDAGDRQFGTG